MKTRKTRWDDLCRIYEIDVGAGILIHVIRSRGLRHPERWNEPVINISATGGMKQAQAYRYVDAVRKALALSKEIQKP
jgi:hypothetical protein